MTNYIIISPLDQFEIRNLFSIDTQNSLLKKNLFIFHIYYYVLYKFNIKDF